MMECIIRPCFWSIAFGKLPVIVLGEEDATLYTISHLIYLLLLETTALVSVWYP
jgi:hypothetical protein